MKTRVRFAGGSGLRVTAVELSAAVVAAAREHFGGARDG